MDKKKMNEMDLNKVSGGGPGHHGGGPDYLNARLMIKAANHTELKDYLGDVKEIIIRVKLARKKAGLYSIEEVLSGAELASVRHPDGLMKALIRKTIVVGDELASTIDPIICY